jgi:hypothetical protein
VNFSVHKVVFGKKSLTSEYKHTNQYTIKLEQKIVNRSLCDFVRMEPLPVVLTTLYEKLVASNCLSFILSIVTSPFSVFLAPYYVIQSYLAEENLLFSAFLICIVTALACYVVSVFTGNWSQACSLLLFCC